MTSRAKPLFLIAIGAFVALLLLASIGSQPLAGDVQEKEVFKPKRIIFVTDFAIGLINGALAGTRSGPSDADDGFAAALALNAPALEVRGLVITYGNNLTKPEMMVARTTLQILGSEIPVLSGATRPLPNPGIELYTGKTLDDSCLNEGTRFMAEQLRRFDNISLVAIGPFTDIACLILNFPAEAARIQEIVILAGSKPGNPLVINGIALPDLNFDSDPRALQIILEGSNIPVTAMLFEVTSTKLISNQQLAALGAMENQVAGYFAAASKPHAQNWTKVLKQDGQVPWDSHPVWYLIKPQAYVCSETGYSLSVGQPSTSPSPDNAFRLDPDFDTRQVQMCEAFARPDDGEAFIEAVLSAVGME